MRKSLFLLLVFLLPVPVQAADLGEVRVAVADRTPSARDDAVVSGLETVLVRLSGDLDARRLPGASTLFAAPTRYLQRYEYELPAPADAEEAEVPDPAADASEDVNELLLVMRFDVASLVERMLSLGMPVWSTRRPGVLGWIVLQRPGFGEILSGASPDPLARAVADQARARGLVLVLPQMDAEDQGRISAADVRGRFDRVVEQASSRYQQPLTLTAIIYSGEPVTVRWRLLAGNGERASGDFVADSEDEAVKGLLQSLVEIQVADYAVSAGTATDRLLQVDGVSNLIQWQSLMTYLNGLDGMEAAQLTRTSGARTTVLLRFSGDTAQLARLLAVNSSLRPCPGQDVEALEGGADRQTPAAELAQMPAEEPVQPALPVYCWQQ